MNRNNPFEIHGINHLSHSSINTWLQDPAKFIADKLFNIRDIGSASMHRGTAIEFGLSKKYEDMAWEIDNTIVEQKFEQLCQEKISINFNPFTCVGMALEIHVLLRLSFL